MFLLNLKSKMEISGISVTTVTYQSPFQCFICNNSRLNEESEVEKRLNNLLKIMEILNDMSQNLNASIRLQSLCSFPTTTDSKEHKHPYVHCSIISTRQGMEAARGSISRWVDKITIGHLHNGILLSMDGPGEHYAKWNKPVRERQIPYDLIHMWNLMNKLK